MLEIICRTMEIFYKRPHPFSIRFPSDAKGTFLMERIAAGNSGNTCVILIGSEKNATGKSLWHLTVFITSRGS